jgi:hypothetical protein
MSDTNEEAPKRYMAVILPEKRGAEAVLLAGYERDGKLFTSGSKVGFALDYYPEEEIGYRSHFKKAVLGDFATRGEAETAITTLFEIRKEKPNV